MAYIYEFAFLCDNLIDANRIMYLLAKDTWPGLGGCSALIGREECFISVHSHDFVSGEKTGSSLYWVEVTPYHKMGPGYVSEEDFNVKDGPKWASGSIPEEDKKRVKMFEKSIIDKIKRWPTEVNFIYAAPGFEVAGFRNKEEISDLLKDYPSHVSFITQNIWYDADCPPGWEFISHHVLECLPPYEE